MDLRYAIFLCFMYGSLAANDYRNQTVECSFVRVNSCFKSISFLGGNFTAVYAEKSTEVNQTCKEKGTFESCMRAVPSQCNDQSAKGKFAIESIISFVGKLCTNNSVEQKNFLNSSVCYNTNRSKREICVKNATSSILDAKSLCCKSSKMEDCLREGMTKVCSKNATDFQENLLHTYSSYTNIMCVPYFKYCNAAIGHLISYGCLLLTVSLSVFQM